MVLYIGNLLFFNVNYMQEGSLRHQIGRDIEESLKHADLNEAGKKPLQADDFQFPEGTNPNIKRVSIEPKKVDVGLKEEVSDILQGLHEASVQIRNEKPLAEAEARKAAAAKKVADLRNAEEEKEWEGAIKLAKQKIAEAEANQVPSVKGVDLRQKIAATLKSEDMARAAADESRWLQAEETAKRKIALEAHDNDQWEAAELAAKKTQAEKRSANQSAIGRLMERLGIKRKK